MCSLQQDVPPINFNSNANTTYLMAARSTKSASDNNMTMNPVMMNAGPADDLDALMESFRSFITFMSGGDKKEPVAQTIQRDGVLRRFLKSEMFEDALSELEACEQSVDRRTVGAFVMIQNVLILSAGIMNETEDVQDEDQ